MIDARPAAVKKGLSLQLSFLDLSTKGTIRKKSMKSRGSRAPEVNLSSPVLMNAYMAVRYHSGTSTIARVGSYLMPRSTG
jgi:hypothetical protein